MPRCVSLIGLGFGDCGKGLFTDALCRRWRAHSVVRFNGGAQAGHNVVLPDGRHHTFSQFGAGTLIPGIATLLTHPVVVHPGALAVEEAHLRTLGVTDAYARLRIDGRCRVTTPYHQAAGRLRELARGPAAHGTCGVGVGETVDHALRHPDHALHYQDLSRPALAMQKLAALRDNLLTSLPPEADLTSSPQAQEERRLLADPSLGEHWLTGLADLLRSVPPTSPEAMAEHLQRPGTLLLEGAQGVLLDEWHGFHPHTTWSSIHPQAAEAVLADYGCHDRVEHLGILRSYLTRHGAGPLPTADAALDPLPEPHNDASGWQGAFRRGHPDAVLLRYARQVTGPLDGLLVSHLDVFRQATRLRWCEAYDLPAALPQGLAVQLSASPLANLPRGPARDLAHQKALTDLLNQAVPRYRPAALADPADLRACLAETLGCPVLLGAFGPSHDKISVFRSLTSPLSPKAPGLAAPMTIGKGSGRDGP